MNNSLIYPDAPKAGWKCRERHTRPNWTAWDFDTAEEVLEYVRRKEREDKEEEEGRARSRFCFDV